MFSVVDCLYDLVINIITKQLLHLNVLKKILQLLLLLLSRFNWVRLCSTPQTTAHQAPLSLGFSRQEYWSGLPFPCPMHACMLSHFSHVRLCVTPMDSNLPDSSVHRILQARILGWVAISFSRVVVKYLLSLMWVK